MTAVWIVLGLLVVGGIVFVAYWLEKKRVEKIRAFAAAQGWTYVDRDDSWANAFAGDPFGEGSERRARSVLRGQYRGRPITVFEYSYVTYSTDSKGNRQKDTHRFEIASIGLPRALPWVQVQREGLFSKVGRALGFKDIELESEDFNKRYKVTAQDRKTAYDVLHPRMMELLLRADGPAWRIEGNALLTWDNGKLELDQVLPRLDYCCAIADTVPDFVWSGS